jgi:aspartate aminotransferase
VIYILYIYIFYLFIYLFFSLAYSHVYQAQRLVSIVPVCFLLSFVNMISQCLRQTARACVGRALGPTLSVTVTRRAVAAAATRIPLTLTRTAQSSVVPSVPVSMCSSASNVTSTQLYRNTLSARKFTSCRFVCRAESESDAAGSDAAQLPGPHDSLNMRVRGLPPSATLRINEASNEMIAQGKKVFKFGLGQSPFPVPEPVVEALRKHAHEKDYLPVKGLPELRDVIAEQCNKSLGTNVTRDDVLIGPGSKELLFLAQICAYNNLVIPVPSWVSYSPQAHILGRKVVWLRPNKNWDLDPEELERVCALDPDQPRLLILNYPNNPTGQTYSVEQLHSIAQICRKYRVAVISDEIYGGVDHNGTHVSLASMYPEGTIVSNGLSKWCGAGGWRLGVNIFPPQLRSLADAMATVASETFTSVSAPIQYAAIEAFRGGEYMQRYLHDQQRVLRALGIRVAAILRSAGIGSTTPQGAFYLWLDFNSKKQAFLEKHNAVTAAQVADVFLQETGVAFLPGSDFGVEEFDLHARIAFVNFDGTLALEKAKSIPTDEELSDQFIEEVCSETIEAAERMAKFFQNL